MRRRLKDTVVVQTRQDFPETNEYGDEDDTLETYWVGTESRALVHETGSAEDETDRETVVRQFDVYFPPETAIGPNDRVVIRVAENEERTCRVLGQPITYRHAQGGLSHTVAKVEAVEG